MNGEQKRSKSDLVLEKISRQRSAKSAPVMDEKVKIVVFTLGRDLYAFTGEEIKEILPFSKVSFVPGCPDFILGVINVRGDIESVIDMRPILKLAENVETPKRRILIGENKNIRSGLLVDSVEDVVDISRTSIRPTTSSIIQGVQNHVLGEIEHNGKNITLLDLDKIFSAVTL